MVVPVGRRGNPGAVATSHLGAAKGQIVRKLVYVLAAVALGAALVWAVSPTGQSRDCTETGCDSQVSFRLSTDLRAGVAYTVEACVDDDCRDETLTVPDDGPIGIGAEGVWLDTDSDVIRLELPTGTSWEETHAVSLRVVTRDGDVVADMTGEADFERTQPNGPDCPPVCWLAEVAA